jgi:serine/threonine protein kinase
MYLSPEMVLKTGHNFMLDVYSLGVLTFELLSGAPPFITDLRNPNQILDDIINSKVHFPEYFSAEVVDILQKMMMRNPEYRICFNTNIKTLLGHQWCQIIREARIKNIRLKSSYIPCYKEQHYPEYPMDLTKQTFILESKIIYLCWANCSVHFLLLLIIFLGDSELPIEPEKNFFGFNYSYFSIRKLKSHSSSDATVIST